jgi:hypothetical protein
MANQNNQPTFSPEALLKIIQSNPEILKGLLPMLKPVAEAMPSQKKITGMEAMTIAAFAKRGFHNVTPKVDVFTKWKWAEQGMVPVEGQKAIRAKALSLFHVSQVRKATSEELAAYFGGVEERKAERQGKPTPAKLPTVSPIQSPVAVMPVQPMPDAAVLAEIEKLKRENAALKSSKAVPATQPQKPAETPPQLPLPTPVKKPAPKSEPELKALKKSKASTKPIGRKPNGTGPQPHV